MKLMNIWRVFMHIAKIGKIRKYLTFYMQIFERYLDDKDAILQMLDIDIREDEDHFIHIKQFINLQDSRVKSLFKKFEKDVNELENEFNIEFEEIKNNSNKNKMIKMLHNIIETYNKKIAKLNKDFQEFKNFQIQKINEINSRNNKKIRKRFV